MKLQNLIYILIGIVCVGLAAHTAHAQKIGEVGFLNGPGGAGSVPVFTDRNALDAFYKANASNDKEGIEELFNARRLFMVNAETRIRVLDSYGFFGSTMEVRILEGKFRNQRGFVSSQWVASSLEEIRKAQRKELDKLAKEHDRLAEESRQAQAKVEEWNRIEHKRKAEEAEPERQKEASRAITPKDTKTWDEAVRGINELLGVAVITALAVLGVIAVSVIVKNWDRAGRGGFLGHIRFVKQMWRRCVDGK